MTDEHKIDGHGGQLALAALEAFGVREMFTLSGGHIFPALRRGPSRYGAHRRRPARTVRCVRRRSRGEAAAASRPGRVDRRSRRHQRHFRHHLGVLQWCSGDRPGWTRTTVPLGCRQPAGDRPRAAGSAITKKAATVTATDDIPGVLRDAALTALSPHRGPVFLDLPLEVVFSVQARRSCPATTAWMCSSPTRRTWPRPPPCWPGHNAR